MTELEALKEGLKSLQAENRRLVLKLGRIHAIILGPSFFDDETDPSQQRRMILNMFFEGDDPKHLAALASHANIDISASNGELESLKGLILGHYRLDYGVYDLDRAKSDHATFQQIEKLKDAPGNVFRN